MDTLLSPTVLFYSKIAAIYFLSVIISRICLRKANSKIGTFIATILLMVGLLAIYFKGNQENTKYKDFGVFRYAKTHEIKSRFRMWSKHAHPDLGQDEKDLSFEEISDKLEFLTDKIKRDFYDKYDRIYDNKDMDDKEIKQIQSYLFQFEFYRLVNISFLWICMLFLLSYLTRSQKIINMSLKLVILKTFIQIFYIYTQPIEEKSIFDSVFPYLTINYQIQYIEYMFALVMGFVWNILYSKFSEKVDMNKKLVKLLQSEVGKNKNSNDEAFKKLKEELDHVDELVNS